jgi:transposase
MLTLPAIYHYYLYRHPADMRKGSGALSGLVRNEMKKDPLSGAIFIFVNRRGDQIRLLHWEGDGFAIYSKRLEEGTFELPPIHTDAASITLSSDDLQLLLRGIVLHSIRRYKRYRRMVNKNVEENQVGALP